MRRRKETNRSIFVWMILITFLISGARAGLTTPSVEPPVVKEPEQPKITRVALLPIDSRPVNTLWPTLLGEAVGFEVVMPPEDALDHFLRSSNFEVLNTWVQNTQADIWILSIPEYLNGGLIQSRDHETYDMSRLNRLLETMPAGPDVYVINVLPRVLPTQWGPAWEYRDQLVQYSVTETGLDGVPWEAVAHYLSLYERAQRVHQKLLEAAEAGRFTYVVGIDDTQPGCIPARQFDAVEPGQQVYPLHGADELALMIIAREANQRTGYRPSFDVEYYGDWVADRTYIYESAPVSELVEEKVAFLHGEMGEGIPVAITPEPTTVAENQAVADLSRSQRWLHRGNLHMRWGTTSNTIGSLLAILGVEVVNDEPLRKLWLMAYVDSLYYGGVRVEEIQEQWVPELLEQLQIDETVTLIYPWQRTFEVQVIFQEQ